MLKMKNKKIIMLLIAMVIINTSYAVTFEGGNFNSAYINFMKEPNGTVRSNPINNTLVSDSSALSRDNFVIQTQYAGTINLTMWLMKLGSTNVDILVYGVNLDVETGVNSMTSAGSQTYSSSSYTNKSWIVSSNIGLYYVVPSGGGDWQISRSLSTFTYTVHNDTEKVFVKGGTYYVPIGSFYYPFNTYYYDFESFSTMNHTSIVQTYAFNFTNLSFGCDVTTGDTYIVQQAVNSSSSSQFTEYYYISQIVESENVTKINQIPSDSTVFIQQNTSNLFGAYYNNYSMITESILYINNIEIERKNYWKIFNVTITNSGSYVVKVAYKKGCLGTDITSWTYYCDSGLSLYGYIKDSSDGKLISNASVAIKNTLTNETQFTSSDDLGKYEFSLSKFGVYNISAYKNGYGVTVEQYNITSFSSIFRKDLYLVPTKLSSNISIYGQRLDVSDFHVIENISNYTIRVYNSLDNQILLITLGTSTIYDSYLVINSSTTENPSRFSLRSGYNYKICMSKTDYVEILTNSQEACYYINNLANNQYITMAMVNTSDDSYNNFMYNITLLDIFKQGINNAFCNLYSYNNAIKGELIQSNNSDTIGLTQWVNIRCGDYYLECHAVGYTTLERATFICANDSENITWYKPQDVAQIKGKVIYCDGSGKTIDNTKVYFYDLLHNITYDSLIISNQYSIDLPESEYSIYVNDSLYKYKQISTDVNISSDTTIDFCLTKNTNAYQCRFYINLTESEEYKGVCKIFSGESYIDSIGIDNGYGTAMIIKGDKTLTCLKDITLEEYPSKSFNCDYDNKTFFMTLDSTIDTANQEDFISFVLTYGYDMLIILFVLWFIYLLREFTK